MLHGHSRRQQERQNKAQLQMLHGALRQDLVTMVSKTQRLVNQAMTWAQRVRNCSSFILQSFVSCLLASLLIFQSAPVTTVKAGSPHNRVKTLAPGPSPKP